MAFTSADLVAIEAAMVTAAVDGIASVNVAGQEVTARSVEELRKLRDMVKGELAVDSENTGLVQRQIVPVYQ